MAKLETENQALTDELLGFQTLLNVKVDLRKPVWFPD